MDTKACLRHCLSIRRATLVASEIRYKSAVIAAQVCTLPVFTASRTIMVYLALPQEVQTADMIAVARSQRKRVVVPVINGVTLLAVELPLAVAQLRRGPFGILEPRSRTAAVRPEKIDFIVVPGLAFDRQGGRLGFGKGYYDRFLSQLPATTCVCGVAFSLQIMPYVPQLSHDFCMPCIVTEQEIIPCRNSVPYRPDSDIGLEWYKGEYR